MKPIRFAFFGDSICVGQGVSIHSGWVVKIAARLEQITLNGSRELVVFSSSVNGSTTRQALERMPYEIQSHGVDLLYVQFGMNDCNHWQTDRGLPRVSPMAFEANLHEIIDRGFRSGAQRIFINTNHPTTRDRQPMPGTSLTYEEGNRQYNEIIRKVVLARSDDVVLVDIESIFKRRISEDPHLRDQLVLDDGLHLSLAGHELYFEAVKPVIEEALRDLTDARAKSAESVNSK